MTDPSKLSDQELLAALNAQPTSPQDQRPGYSLTPAQDAAEVAAGRIPAQHVRIDPQTWQRTSVGGDPASMSNAQLQAALANTDPNMSGAEDTSRSLVSGLEQGITGLAGAPGGIVRLAQMGGDMAGHAIADWTGIPYHQDADVKAGTMFGQHIPVQADFDAGMQRAAGPYHEPQTTAGHYARAIGQFAPGALAPGGLVTRAVSALAPAVASETAGELTSGTSLEPWARTAGALLGGVGVGTANSIANAPARAAGAALGEVAPEQLRLAAALKQNSPIPLTTAEAVQQVTGGSTGLGRLQHFWENSPASADQARPFFAQRPAAVRDAVAKLADQIAPPTAQPGMVGQRAQQAATGALNSARQTVNSIAGPDYAALPAQMMEREPYAELAADPSYAAALQELRSHPEISARYADMPDRSLGVVNAVQKRLATRAEQAAGTPMAPGDNELAAIRTGAGALTDEYGRAASEHYGGQYGSARDTVRELSGQFVDPLKAGPLGAVSTTPNVGAQTAALFPSAPPEGASAETATALRVAALQDPTIGADLLRQHVMNTANAATGDLTAGPNQWGGAALAKALAGNPEQEATLRAGFDVAAPQASDDFGDLLEAMRATGKRMPAGSLTAFNQELRDRLNLSPTPIRTLGRLVDPLEYGKHLDQAVGGAMYRRQLQGIGDLLLSDDPTAAYRQMQTANTPALARALLTAPSGGDRR